MILNNYKGTNQYRPEIDGLRAISILGVLVNHFDKNFLPSGYLGVDIFFLISGYVITSSITSKKWSSLGDFLITFYEKGLKRILPALLAYTLIISTLITLINHSPITSLRTGLFSIFGLSNIYLFKQSTFYFGQAAELNPFLQTWSLGIEEQFYVIYPLIFWWFGYKNNQIRKLGKVMLFITLVSFILFILFYNINISATYFLLPFRFWEISVGCLLFIFSKDINFSGNKLKDLTSIFSLTILLFNFCLPIEYGIITTISTILFTAILLLSIREGNIIYSFLTNKIFLYIGSISYSLYLWHWGILSLSKWILPNNWIIILIQLLLTFIISIISYEFLEKKFRYRSNNTKTKTITNYLALMSLFSLLLIVLENIKTLLYLPRVLGVSKIETWGNLQKCNGKNNLKKYIDPIEYCLGDESTIKDNNIFLIGDSHAMQFEIAINKSIENSNFELKYINTEENNDFPRSFLANKNSYKTSKTIQKVISESKPNDIVAISFHRGYLNSIRDTHISEYESKIDNKKYFITLKNFKEFFKKLNDKNVKVIIIRDIPMLKLTIDISTCIIQDKIFKINSCDVDKKQDTYTRARQDRLYNQLKELFPNIYIWDPREIMNYYENYYSYKNNKNEIIMIDQHHLSKQFSESFYKNLKSFLIQNKLIQTKSL